MGVEAAEVCAELERVGYAVVPGLADEATLRAVRAAVGPHLADGPQGRNEFEGLATKRVYCLVAKSRAFDALILEPSILDVAEQILGPNFLLTATLAIDLLPHQPAQSLHSDDAFYSIPRPRPAVSLSIMWAVDPFTAANGGTIVCPGSHRWGESVRREDVQTVPVELAPGDAFVYLGTLIHGGGANTTEHERLGISIQYAKAWARQQENFALALGSAARELDPRLQELIGYSIHPPFMGMIDGRHPRKFLEAMSPPRSSS